MFKIYQIQLTDAEIAQLNREGWECENPRIKAYAARSFNFTPEMFQYYDHVANVDTDEMEQAFYLMNMWTDESKVERVHASVSSLSVGDILVDEAGDRFICASFGFDKF